LVCAQPEVKEKTRGGAAVTGQLLGWPVTLLRFIEKETAMQVQDERKNRPPALSARSERTNPRRMDFGSVLRANTIRRFLVPLDGTIFSEQSLPLVTNIVRRPRIVARAQRRYSDRPSTLSRPRELLIRCQSHRRQLHPISTRVRGAFTRSLRGSRRAA
jgi:hypothetical protein